MSNTVNRAAANWRPAVSLYAANGARKYLNIAERQRALAAMQELAPEKALFALTLAWTGARVSEVLALSAASFQVEPGLVSIVTLKRRRFTVREVPIPPELMAALDRQFQLSEQQRHAETAYERLWPRSRVTAWKLIKRVMQDAGVVGRHACPRGLRHAFGVGTLQAGVPINKTKEWLGHASLGTTAIYAAACGPEERAFAERFWRLADLSSPGPSGALDAAVSGVFGSMKILSNKADQLSEGRGGPTAHQRTTSMGAPRPHK